MERTPKWNQIAEDLMQLLGHETDPSQLQTRNAKIKSVYCEDEEGNTRFISLESESLAEGPSVSGPFNPRDN